MGKNECTVPRRVTKKNSSVINKKMKIYKVKKRTNITENIYYDDLLFVDDTLENSHGRGEAGK